jgi:trans-aconitate methyltransferase
MGCRRLQKKLQKTAKMGSVPGIDNSPEMIDLAKKTFSREKYPNLSFELCDACKLDFNGKFDVVFSNAALHWIPDQKRFFME